MKKTWIAMLLGLGLVIGLVAVAAAADGDRSLFQPGFSTGSAMLDEADLERTQGVGAAATASGELTGIWFGAAPGEPQSTSLAVEETWLEPVLTLSLNSIATLSTVTLDASGSRSSSGIILFEWDLDGDDVFDTTTNGPTFDTVYEQDGVRALRVRVTDLRGNTATSPPTWLAVTNREPIASFTMGSLPATDTGTVTFHEAAADRDGSIVSWSWDFGDGSLSTEPNPVHAYQESGDYAVALTVIDDNGASAVHQTMVAVENSLPMAEFAIASTSMQVGQAVHLADESVDPSPNGEIVHVAWDFGDGTHVAGGPSADGMYQHTYTEPGSYTVILYVIDDMGGLSQVQSEILIGG